jgi:glutaredoxin-related protein
MTTNAKIKKLIDDNEVLLFMKGNPTFLSVVFLALLAKLWVH